MAFPGCVIFLPPTAAAARFLLAAYERWCADSPAAARRRDGSCGWGSEPGHRPLLTPQLSHGPALTENGFSREDMAVKLLEKTAKWYLGAPVSVGEQQHNSEGSAGWLQWRLSWGGGGGWG